MTDILERAREDSGEAEKDRQFVTALYRGLEVLRAFRPGDPAASEQVREMVAWGPGPRAAQALMLTVRARALLQGRLAPSPEDVIAMAKPVLSHRMALRFAARARGDSLPDLIDETVAGLAGVEAAA